MNVLGKKTASVFLVNTTHTRMGGRELGQTLLIAFFGTEVKHVDEERGLGGGIPYIQKHHKVSLVTERGNQQVVFTDIVDVATWAHVSSGRVNGRVDDSRIACFCATSVLVGDGGNIYGVGGVLW